ncbi:MAG: molybdopterin molybdenumtransferase MoeA, partial [Leucobacter sp.]
MTVTPEQHLGWILARAPRLPSERVPLDEALGRTLAADAAAQHSLPLWDNSAMDGYAVRSSDIAGAGPGRPVALRVTGEVAAGSADDPPLAAGEAVRIMTGAPVPTAADAVVAVERTSGETGPGSWAEHRVEIGEAAPAGRNIRRRGEDVGAG